MSKPGQRVLSVLRKMIASGELAEGERLAEIPTADRLAVSRTPVRIALRTLEQEGLLTKLPGRGFAVRKTSPEEIDGAIEVRGVLEGLAARQAAEKGLPNKIRGELLSCLERGDALFEKGYVSEEDLEAYQELNLHFHTLIIEASENLAIANALSRNEHLPFASVSALAVDPKQMTLEYKRFNFAHMQHHAVFDAIDRGQGARASALMCEHANATLRYSEIFANEKKNTTLRIISSKKTQ